MTLAAVPVSLPDVSVSRADIASVRGRLRSYQARYAPLFGRRELRGHARTYLRGLLSDEPRKSVERMVLRLHGADANAVRTQQLFLRQARWDDAPILAAHRELVAATLGADEGVLALDGTDMPKDGTESVGVARQYCGQLGKRANCQAAVFAAYLGRGAAALVDRRLYLSRDWVSGASHAARRQRTGVPADIPFRTKPQLALDMLTALVAEGSLPVRWVTCDEGFSVSHAFLDGVAALGLGYLAEVARNTHVWTTRPQQSGSPSRPVFSAPSQEVGAVADRLPRAAWRPFILREGSKGPQTVLCVVLRVAACRGLEPGPDVWLLLRRNPVTDELKSYLGHGPADMAPERLVWLAGLRWPIEQCFRDGKQLFGLGDYEGRSWQGWHRHATLVMLAHFFVVRETLRLKKSTPA
ncbi:MAG: IS701 family transposase [Caldilineaceae bacterium]|nr:IS701 family transposase [Caldilineaceae bacterium]